MDQGGITSIAINATDEQKLATAGLDGQVQIFDRSSGRIVSCFQEHSKKVNSVVWVSETTIATGSADRSVRLWPGTGAATVFKVCSIPTSWYRIVNRSADKTRFFPSACSDQDQAMITLMLFVCG